MKYRRLEENNEMCFGRGVSDYLQDQISSPDAILQAIKTRMYLFLGECWWDVTDGLPLWQQILGASMRDGSIVEQIIVDRIKGLIMPDGRYAITAISAVISEYVPETRHLNFSCTVDTVFGKLYVTNASQTTNQGVV